ncbi:MAG: CBS domain-containing protein [Gammaproteobacteria bacterium]|nr:CBS domain-containing protein [Gammaproteobacteria bacterium]
MDTVQDIMTTSVLSVRDDWSPETLSQFFFDKQISGAPVIDEDENLVGVVSLNDLARNDTAPATDSRESSGHDYYEHSKLVQGISREDLELLAIESESITTVRDIMTSLVFEVTQDTSIQEAAEMMLKGHIHRLLVTNEKKLVGIVTTMDMLKTVVSG